MPVHPADDADRKLPTFLLKPAARVSSTVRVRSLRSSLPSRFGALAITPLNAIAEPARGSWHRYLGWTVGLLPIPRDWHHARMRLASLAERGEAVTSGELWDAAVDVYGLSTAAVAPLAAWILGPTQ